MFVSVCAVIERESQTLSHINNLLIGIWHWDVASIPVPLSLSSLISLCYIWIFLQYSWNIRKKLWFCFDFNFSLAYSDSRALLSQFDNHLVYTQYFSYLKITFLTRKLYGPRVRTTGGDCFVLINYQFPNNYLENSRQCRLRQKWEDASRCMRPYLQIISSNFRFVSICRRQKVVISE